MTDSTDSARGPERIVLQPCPTYGWTHPDCVKYPVSPATEYIRSDLAPGPLADPRVVAMVEALRKISALDDIAECCGQGVCGGYSPPECCGQPIYGLDRAHNIARAALAALSPTGGNADVY